MLARLDTTGLALTVLSLLLSVVPALDQRETVWSEWIAKKLHGEPEAAFDDDRGAGRVDVLTARHAIEVEWAKAPKGPESLTQASRYAKAFDREPVVVFLVRGEDSGHIAELAIVRAVRQFGQELSPPVRVLWIDCRRPDLEKLKRELRDVRE